MSVTESFNDLAEVLREVFSRRGWEVKTRASMKATGLSFDFVAENDTAVVFAVVLPVNQVLSSSTELASEVASVTLRRPNSKSWEAYLILATTGISEETVEGLQDVQRDLNYCRKIILDGDALLRADDAVEKAYETLSFLFPLDVMDAGVLPDVRSLLVEHLIARGLRQPLPQSLLDHFQDDECQCISLMSGQESNEP